MDLNVAAPSKHPAHALLSKVYPPSTADAIFSDKVLHKPLHLRPTSPDPSSQDARGQRRLQRLRKDEHKLRRRKPKPLSAKEKRISGIYDIPKEQQKYDIYVPLHKMWVEYMWEVLGMKEGQKSYVTAQSAGSMLASADYHGAELTVVRSRCVGMVGLRGIVVRDTKFTFQVITNKNELKSMFLAARLINTGVLTCSAALPKRHSVFRVEIPQASGSLKTVPAAENTGEGDSDSKSLAYEIHGSHFENRATDRATKKFKQRNMSDL